MILSWIKCHVFGRHLYHCFVEVVDDDNNIEIYVTCLKPHCSFAKGAITKLHSRAEYFEQTGKYKHLTLIK